MRYLEDDIGNETRQKGFSNILRSDVHIALASVYCYCLRATKLLLKKRTAVCCLLRRTAVVLAVSDS